LPPVSIGRDLLSTIAFIAGTLFEGAA
jgi:hypothetical protein